MLNRFRLGLCKTILIQECLSVMHLASGMPWHAHRQCMHNKLDISMVCVTTVNVATEPNAHMTLAQHWLRRATLIFLVTKLIFFAIKDAKMPGAMDFMHSHRHRQAC